jgi:hypothetical protein
MRMDVVRLEPWNVYRSLSALTPTRRAQVAPAVRRNISEIYTEASVLHDHVYDTVGLAMEEDE